jgi:hypothetical protein
MRHMGPGRTAAWCGVLGLGLTLACLTMRPRPPLPPSLGPGAADYAYDAVLSRTLGEGAQALTVFYPDGVRARRPLPVVVFFHAYQGIPDAFYGAWITHLVRRGHMVLYPVWQWVGSLPEEFADNATAALELGLAWLPESGIPVDLGRVAFLGHSAGGVLALNLTVRSARAELGLRPAALMLLAPGRKFPNDLSPELRVESAAELPANLNLVVMDFEEDTTVERDLALTLFQNATAVPRKQRTFLRVRSDPYGTPGLKADHHAPTAPKVQVPLGFVTDALDIMGSWRIADALLSCTFEGLFCDVALGEGHSQKDMGRWSDGTPVKPMLNDWEL